MLIYIHIVSLVVRNDMDVNGHERLSNITLRQTQIKVKEQLVVRNDMDVNEDQRLSNITLRHQLKVEEKLVLRNDTMCDVRWSVMFIYIHILSYYKLFLYCKFCSKYNVR
jgi:hypothetical protein